MNSSRRHRWVGTFVLLGVVIIMTPALVYHYRDVPVIHWKAEPPLPVLTIPQDTASATHVAPVDSLPAAWVVEITGVFNDGSAALLVTKLTGQQMKAFSLTASAVTHVYIGPFLEKSDANEALATLTKKMHLAGAVVSYNPLQQ